MYQIKVEVGAVLDTDNRIILTTGSRKLARAMKELADSCHLDCQVVRTLDPKAVKFKGLDW